MVYRELGKYPYARIDAIPMSCMHCADPACQKVCPTGATEVQNDGTVTVDNQKCVGCRFCMIACPYGSRSFYSEEHTYFPDHKTPYEAYMSERHQIGTVSKCDFCLDRRKEGLNPSCVDVCPTKARSFGDLDDPHNEVSRLIAQKRAVQLHQEYGTDPSVYYIQA